MARTKIPFSKVAMLSLALASFWCAPTGSSNPPIWIPKAQQATSAAELAKKAKIRERIKRAMAARPTSRHP
ncbi:hypothetical protein ACNUI4_15865 [Pseudomonas aeruginosa]